MVQPNPPGDLPLFEGLDSSWNDIVGAFPEDKRAELAPRLKERIDSFNNQLKPWEDFSKTGVKPEDVKTALNLYKVVENNPREVYETIGKHLGITAQQAQQVAETVENADPDDDPRIANLQRQFETLAQITLAKQQQETQAAENAAADAALDKEMTALKKKYSDVDEEEIIMRMIHKNMTAEQAYNEYSGKVTALRQRPISPMVLGGNGGMVPAKQIDPTKLDSSNTKSLVVQMLQQSAAERNK